MLLLDRGDAAGALAGFDAYLSRPRRGLEAEALVGRARALQGARFWGREAGRLGRGPAAVPELRLRQAGDGATVGAGSAVKWARGLLCAAALAGAASPWCSACGGGIPSLAQVRVVRIQVDGDAAAVARTRVVASELFERLGVASLVSTEPDVEAMSSPGAGRQVLARAYFDLRDPTTPGIVVVDAQTEREIVRRTFPDSASLEISVEELTHVLYAVVEVMLQTERPAPEVAPAPAAGRGASSGDELLPPPDARRASAAPAERVGPTVALGAFARLLALDSSSDRARGWTLASRLGSRDDGLAWGGTLMAALHASNEIVFEEARGGVRPFSLRAYGTVSGLDRVGGHVDRGPRRWDVDILRVETNASSVRHAYRGRRPWSTPSWARCSVRAFRSGAG